jgi:hypothetical protein
MLPAAVLPISNLTCTYNSIGFNHPCPVSAGDLQLSPSGSIAGVKYFLTNPGSTVEVYDTSTNGTTTSLVSFSSHGIVTGTTTLAGSPIGFLWDFDLALNLNGQFGVGFGTLNGGQWTMSFDIETTAGHNSVFSSTPTFSGANAPSVIGGGGAFTSADITSGVDYTVIATLQDTWTRLAGSPALDVTIPLQSFDVGAPEPASFVLMALGLGLVAWGRRKRTR